MLPTNIMLPAKNLANIKLTTWLNLPAIFIYACTEVSLARGLH